MKELSLHILDIVQNSLQAGADDICIEIEENIAANFLVIIIKDNGCGISDTLIAKLLDPFYTTKNKKTGLGIPLLKQHTEMAGGKLEIFSKLGNGTKVRASFEHNNLDRQPIGDIAGTLSNLIRSNPAVRFYYKHKVDNKEFIFDTIEFHSELEGIPINSNKVIRFIEEYINENLDRISISE